MKSMIAVAVCAFSFAFAGIARADCFTDLLNTPAGQVRDSLAVTNNSQVNWASYGASSLMTVSATVDYRTGGYAHVQFSQYFSDRVVSCGDLACFQGFSQSAADQYQIWINSSGSIYYNNITWGGSGWFPGQCLGSNVFTFSVGGTYFLVSYSPAYTPPFP